MKVLGLIPARGGSKGVPRKNIKLLCGKPLLEYTTRAALASKFLHRVVLSTEDEEIAAVGKRLGVDVPFIRPVNLATDDAATLSVVLHAVETLEKGGDYYDAICLLQPTNPLRTADLIDQAVLYLTDNENATSVVSVREVPKEYNPHWVYFQNPDGYLVLSTGEEIPISRRQLLPSAFHRDGSVYLTRRNVLVNERSLYGSHVLGITIPENRSINIDTLDDWDEAERIISEHHLSESK